MRRLPTKKYRVTLLFARRLNLAGFNIGLYTNIPSRNFAPRRSRVPISLPINRDRFQRILLDKRGNWKKKQIDDSTITLAYSRKTSSLCTSTIPCNNAIGDRMWNFSDSVTPYIRSNLFDRFDLQTVLLRGNCIKKNVYFLRTSSRLISAFFGISYLPNSSEFFIKFKGLSGITTLSISGANAGT